MQVREGTRSGSGAGRQSQTWSSQSPQPHAGQRSAPRGGESGRRGESTKPHIPLGSTALRGSSRCTQGMARTHLRRRDGKGLTRDRKNTLNKSGLAQTHGRSRWLAQPAAPKHRHLTSAHLCPRPPAPERLSWAAPWPAPSPVEPSRPPANLRPGGCESNFLCLEAPGPHAHSAFKGQLCPSRKQVSVARVPPG